MAPLESINAVESTVAKVLSPLKKVVLSLVPVPIRSTDIVPVVILAALERLVAVVAVPLKFPVNVVAVIAPETFTSSSSACPFTSRLPSVPTLVRDELTTLDPKVVALRTSV